MENVDNEVLQTFALNQFLHYGMGRNLVTSTEGPPVFTSISEFPDINPDNRLAFCESFTERVLRCNRLPSGEILAWNIRDDHHMVRTAQLDPDNVKELYKRVSKGATGMIVYEPVMFARTDDGRIFMEVDRDIYEAGGATIDDARHIANSLKIADMIDWSRAAAIVNAFDGIAHDVTAKK